MSESAKYETISLRLPKQDADLIRAYAAREKTNLSSIIRSTMNKLVNNQIVFVDSQNNAPLSPSPAFDKLSFRAREFFLAPFELAVFAYFSQGFNIQEVEKAMLFSLALAEQDNIDRFASELGVDSPYK